MDDESIIFIISSHLLYNTQRELFKFLYYYLDNVNGIQNP